ncbi:hypothetical protein [Chlamydiifrater volucris]|uniref:hypothetical protein n=1 Tax=Chlamydiifrater volucris TaxID=2681470 RepID=UPI0032B216AC
MLSLSKYLDAGLGQCLLEGKVGQSFEGIKQKMRGGSQLSVMTDWSSQFMALDEEIVGRACSHLKSEVRKMLSQFEREICSKPLLCMNFLAGDSSHWVTRVQKEASRDCRIESIVALRSRRELGFIFLGVFFREELVEIVRFYDSIKEDGKLEEVLYAECIKLYPKIITAEALYFSWLRNSFPYLGNAQSAIFREAWRYKSSLFLRLSSFVNNWPSGEEKAGFLFEAFTGWIPACLSNFDMAKILSEQVSILGEKKLHEWDWRFFCKKVSEFCRCSIFHENIFGDWLSFMEFSDKGEAAEFFNKKTFSFNYEKTVDNFFLHPKAIWDMSSLCRKDSELLLKIEEGLSAVGDSYGYFGEQSIKEVQDFERVILGLKMP